ncbi:Aa trans domain-containing protein [Citrus sinensis]|uniref:Aa trans domain-containing protein n=1 Tax=Citrus sinensis TaxID=2711 RepID=A0ACB8P4R7_CITSI|nr:Aa trans domain-containing protein [Citrus sinensis]
MILTGFILTPGIDILSIPYALSSGGWLSLIILVLIAATACFTALLLRQCMDKDPDTITSYIDIVGHAFGHKGGVMILPTMWLNDLGILSFVSAGGVLSSIIVTVLLLSFVICTITYLTMAVLGYLIYGQNVQSQITLNLPIEQVSSKVAIYTILAGPIAKYALTVMSIATAIERQLSASYKDCRSASILIRMSLLVSTVVLATVFPSFQSVTSLIGAFLKVVVSFLLPCVSYLNISEVYRNWGYELIGILAIMLLAVFFWGVGYIFIYCSNCKADLEFECSVHLYLVFGRSTCHH